MPWTHLVRQFSLPLNSDVLLHRPLSPHELHTRSCLSIETNFTIMNTNVQMLKSSCTFFLVFSVSALPEITPPFASFLQDCFRVSDPGMIHKLRSNSNRNSSINDVFENKDLNTQTCSAISGNQLKFNPWFKFQCNAFFHFDHECVFYPLKRLNLTSTPTHCIQTTVFHPNIPNLWKATSNFWIAYAWILMSMHLIIRLNGVVWIQVAQENGIFKDRNCFLLH